MEKKSKILWFGGFLAAVAIFLNNSTNTIKNVSELRKTPQAKFSYKIINGIQKPNRKYRYFLFFITNKGTGGPLQIHDLDIKVDKKIWKLVHFNYRGYEVKLDRDDYEVEGKTLGFGIPAQVTFQFGLLCSSESKILAKLLTPESGEPVEAELIEDVVYSKDQKIPEYIGVDE